ncbi:MarR family transcriptional regulator [Desulfosarcina ovata subsp. sediminis]|uniref:MarR family transcriptional regulator n=2 Tax=Desulfosarcina ovata TaxID=83564 RepID=A0A5K8AIU1_9BACT|nr:MarR family transcriptional regulator [Desulfosarcina ovata subsp. sediminis]BBO92419.1 MarR family transcriptional regulator [Desulfosarcina ovata subsp. ovata]
MVLARAASAVEKADRTSIAQSGLIPSDFGILEALLHKGPLPINTIGRKVLLTSGSMTAAANRLMARNLVERIKDPCDGRSFQLHLTSTGRRLIEGIYAKHARNLESIAAVLSDQERCELVRLLKKLGHHAQTVAMG